MTIRTCARVPALLLLLGLPGCPGGPTVETTKPDTTKPDTTQPDARAQAEWEERMNALPPQPEGCYRAAYPRVEWTPIECGAAPDYPIIPANGPRYFVVGNGANDYSAVATPAPISAVEGTFVSVSPGITETGPTSNTGTANANAYTLQINTNPLTTSVCGAQPNCQGWEQFVYENNPTTHIAFIQYWLLRYNAACPSGWNQFQFTGQTDIYCYRSTPSSALLAGHPVSDLGSMTLSAKVDATSDSVTIRAGTDMAMRSGSNSVLAATGWTDAEFNVFGDAGNADGGGQANFGANTTLTVRTTVHNGTRNAPTCRLMSYTGETNNLTLVGMAPIGVQPSPAIEFTESNTPGTAAACMTAAGVGDTHMSTFGGLLYDFQASGDFLLAESGGFAVQGRLESGAPQWPSASVNKAVAMRLAGSRVAICSGDTDGLRIDGKPVALADGEVREVPGGAVRRVGDVFLVVDDHGNSLRAALRGTHVDATVGLGEWPANVRGVLADGAKTGEIVASDGSVLATPFAFAYLYSRFADSWRVAPADSLLVDCGPVGEQGAPKAPFSKRDLDPKDLERATAVCRQADIPEGGMLDACILDVTVLGKEDAAAALAELRKPVMVGEIR